MIVELYVFGVKLTQSSGELVDVQKSGMDPIFKMKSRIQEGEIKILNKPMKRALKSDWAPRISC